MWPPGPTRLQIWGLAMWILVAGDRGGRSRSHSLGRALMTASTGTDRARPGGARPARGAAGPRSSIPPWSFPGRSFRGEHHNARGRDGARPVGGGAANRPRRPHVVVVADRPPPPSSRSRGPLCFSARSRWPPVSPPSGVAGGRRPGCWSSSARPSRHCSSSCRPPDPSTCSTTPFTAGSPPSATILT